MHVGLQPIEEGGGAVAASPLLHDLLRVLVDVRMESGVLHTACTIILQHSLSAWSLKKRKRFFFVLFV